MIAATDAKAQSQLAALHHFLATAPAAFRPGENFGRFQLPNGEFISCVLWQGLFHITGTDIVRALVFRFEVCGRPIRNMKKFEEGVFSDLRNLKPGQDATLQQPRSEFLELLYKNGCIRTQKKQKVFYWFSVPHEKLFKDALQRDLRRVFLGLPSLAENPAPRAVAHRQSAPLPLRRPSSLPSNSPPRSPAMVRRASNPHVAAPRFQPNARSRLAVAGPGCMARAAAVHARRSCLGPKGPGSQSHADLGELGLFMIRGLEHSDWPPLLDMRPPARDALLKLDAIMPLACDATAGSGRDACEAGGGARLEFPACRPLEFPVLEPPVPVAAAVLPPFDSPDVHAAARLAAAVSLEPAVWPPLPILSAPGDINMLAPRGMVPLPAIQECGRYVSRPGANWRRSLLRVQRNVSSGLPSAAARRRKAEPGPPSTPGPTRPRRPLHAPRKF